MTIRQIRPIRLQVSRILSRNLLNQFGESKAAQWNAIYVNRTKLFF